MGEYLRLLIAGTDALTSREVYPHSVLEMGQNYETLGQIFDLAWVKEMASHRHDIPDEPRINTHPLPADVEIYVFREGGYEMTRTDATGGEMTWAYARDLAKIEVPGIDHVEGDWPIHSRNRAVRAYLDALPGNTPVLLYRH